jgi:uncharacterized protein YceH (UPF0502 family)
MHVTDNFAMPQALPPVRPDQTGLSDAETRVLGCLIEKQRTTPDQYPLTLNALRLACNQSTNRDPVVDYDDAVLRDALHKLERRGLVRLASGRGSRAPKYRHLLAEALPMSADEQALMCVLMLRGAQTPGELKQRSDRMHAFAGLAAVAQTLERLCGRRLAERLDRRPGQKEERYGELLSGEGAAASAVEAEPTDAGPTEAWYGDGSAPEAHTPEAHTPEAHAPEALAPRTAVPAVSLEEFDELRARVARLERELASLREEDADERADADARPGEPSAWEVN